MRFKAQVVTGDDPTMQLTGLIPAMRSALKKAGLTITDLDWIEVNAAFRTVVLSWADELKPDMKKVTLRRRHRPRPSSSRRYQSRPHSQDARRP